VLLEKINIYKKRPKRSQYIKRLWRLEGTARTLGKILAVFMVLLGSYGHII